MDQHPVRDKQAHDAVVSEGKELSLPHLRVFARPGELYMGDRELPTICGDVVEAAHAQTEQLARNGPSPSRDTLLRVEAMIGVISYCYVKGMLESCEIERRLWQDEAFLGTFGSELPTAQRIRRFRRRHRSAILATIERALVEFRRRTTSSPSQPPSPVALSEHDSCEAVRSKAEYLLDMANIVDQLSLDE